MYDQNATLFFIVTNITSLIVGILIAYEFMARKLKKSAEKIRQMRSGNM